MFLILSFILFVKCNDKIKEKIYLIVFTKEQIIKVIERRKKRKNYLLIAFASWYWVHFELISRHANFAFNDFIYNSSISRSFFIVELTIFKDSSCSFLFKIESSYFFSDLEIFSKTFYLLPILLAASSISLGVSNFLSESFEDLLALISGR